MIHTILAVPVYLEKYIPTVSIDKASYLNRDTQSSIDNIHMLSMRTPEL